MKKLIVALAGLAASALAVPAAASVTVTFGGTTPVPGNNNFNSQLSVLGLTQLATTGATLVLDANSTIMFELLGTESGYNDTFSTLSAPNLTYTEYTSFLNSFASPTPVGSASFAAGSLAGLLNFSSVGGASATVGQDGFGIFLGPNAVSGQSLSTFYLGYDDQIRGQDDDHDDMIIRATVLGAVPEPGTWGMMIIGFGAVGFAIRRQKKGATLPQFA